jgi:hypothetical protein
VRIDPWQSSHLNETSLLKVNAGVAEGVGVRMGTSDAEEGPTEGSLGLHSGEARMKEDEGGRGEGETAEEETAEASTLGFFFGGLSEVVGPANDGRAESGGESTGATAGRSESERPYESSTSKRMDRGSWARMDRSRSLGGVARATLDGEGISLMMGTEDDDDLEEEEVVVQLVMEGGGGSRERFVAAMLILEV